MGVNDTEGNTGKKQSNNVTVLRDRVAPWHLAEHGDNGAGVNWSHADAVLLRDLIDTVTRTGAAISLSATRDLRGVSVTVLDGPDRPKFYASSPEELKSLLRRLTGTR